eukprot:m.113399 g.113399  ORF g.113399 m.113399 type:complete len:539 (+) comp13512_c0_seq3:160-1776(+)
MQQGGRVVRHTKRHVVRCLCMTSVQYEESQALANTLLSHINHTPQHALDHLNAFASTVDGVYDQRPKLPHQPQRNTTNTNKLQAQRPSAARNGEDQAQGTLKGLTMAVKDNFTTTSLPTTCSSKMLENYMSPFTATVVDRAEKAGALMVGKTVLDEFGMGSFNLNSSLHSPCFNPWVDNQGKVCVSGGSSGGSAVAVASGQADFALGSDTGGSIRLPASYCGVVGFKPSYGRLSRFGLVAYASSLDTPGVLAPSVYCAAQVVDALSGHDNNDSTSAQLPATTLVDSLSAIPKRIRIGIPEEAFIQELQPDVKQCWLNAIDRLEQLGCDVVSISIPSIKSALPCYYVLAMAETSSNMARFTGINYGKRAVSAKDAEDFTDMIAQSRLTNLGPEVLRRIITGNYLLSRDSYESFYEQAQKVRALIRKEFSNVFAQGVSALLLPSTSSSAPSLESVQQQTLPTAPYTSDVFVSPVSLAGLPAMSVPAGVSDTAMPIGLQVVGNMYDEKAVVQVSALIEREMPFSFDDLTPCTPTHLSKTRQ